MISLMAAKSKSSDSIVGSMLWMLLQRNVAIFLVSMGVFAKQLIGPGKGSSTDESMTSGAKARAKTAQAARLKAVP